LKEDPNTRSRVPLPAQLVTRITQAAFDQENAQGTTPQNPPAGTTRPFPQPSEHDLHPQKSFALNFNVVRWISTVTPWVAPIPSAFFVAHSAMCHLGTPLSIALVLAAVIELLGLTSVHTWLRLSNWNLSRRKSDPGAPTPTSSSCSPTYISGLPWA
jgi:hypothetical protein